MTPELVLGFRHAQVDANGDTDGGDVSMSFNLVGGVTPGKLRAKYFNGQEKVQSEVGAGYDFTHGLFAGVSVQGPYTNIGVDYLFYTSSPFEPFSMLNTLKTNDKPAATTCPVTWAYSSNDSLCHSPIIIN
jgi:lipid-binding SYLF domain-containing protein